MFLSFHFMTLAVNFFRNYSLNFYTDICREVVKFAPWNELNLSRKLILIVRMIKAKFRKLQHFNCT